LISENMKVSK